MFFVKNGSWSPLDVAQAARLALFGIVACIGTGAMVQSNAIGGVLEASFGVSPYISAVALLVLSSVVLLGGVKRIAGVAGRIVPIMALCYAAMSLVVIVLHIDQVPGIFAMVLREAFSPSAAQGGAAGASIMLAIRMGMARGIFSNEAGLGAAPMARARGGFHQLAHDAGHHRHARHLRRYHRGVQPYRLCAAAHRRMDRRSAGRGHDLGRL